MVDLRMEMNLKISRGEGLLFTEELEFLFLH